ncbi:unnamed protein product, partial [marine sediment metagenome]
GLTVSNTVMMFDHEPLAAAFGQDGTQAWGGIAVGTTHLENIFIWPDGSMVTHNIGTQAIFGPVFDANGCDLAGDKTNAEGIEWCAGYVGHGKQTFTVKTDACYLKVSLIVSDVSGAGDIAIGFRLQEDFQDTIEGYRDYQALSIDAGTIMHMQEIDAGSPIDADSGGTVANQVEVELEVRINADRTVEFFIDGDTPGTEVTHTWADAADEITPFLFILHDTDVAGPVYVTRWECGLQN